MKALLFTGNHTMRLVERPMPQAKGHDVVVKMLASGVCGTDTELLLPKSPPNSTVPGHEGVGVVFEVDEAQKVKVGDRVMIDCHVTCRKCVHCASGDEIFCPELKAIGFELDGTNAEYLSIPEDSLRPLPNELSAEVGVLIGDALGTPYHAVKKANIEKGEFVSVFGVGPLGTMAVFCAFKRGARVIAVDLNETRLDSARKFGAEFTVNPTKSDVKDEIMGITGGRGVSAAIQCTPSAKAISQALDSLKLRGVLVQVGVCESVTLNPLSQINDREITIIGSRNFNANELGEIEAFVRANPFVGELITHRFPLSQAAEAFETAALGLGLKVLILPNA